MPFWDRLRRKKQKEPPQPDGVKTAPLDPSALQHVIQPQREASRRVVVGSAQSTGVERSHNEDALFTMSGTFAGEVQLGDFGLFVVADGMGGHRAGELASAVSVRTVAHRLITDAFVHFFDLETDGELPPLQEVVRTALEEANQAVVDRVPGGGTTLTAAVLVGQQITIGHVGDTRAYFIKDNQANPVTRDHSLVRRLEELGQLTSEEAEGHPQRNVLYRAIGQGANLEVDVFTHRVPAGGYLLICSDGLWGVVPDQDIVGIISMNASVQEACEGLVKAANAAGGPDNISAILIKFPGE